MTRHCFFDIIFIKKNKGDDIIGTVSVYIWAVVIIVAVFVEASTAQLVCIWFVAGALAAMISAFLKASFAFQVIIFLVVTIAALFLTRPLVRKITQFKKEDTNAGRYVGKEGFVTAEINNTKNSGLVSVMGTIWSAKSESGEILFENELIEVVKIEGVKLVVKKK